jgi:hypothetical protein
VNCLLGCSHIVRVFRNDSLTPCCFHDCFMNGGMNPSREHNPVILCQISESYVFVLSSRVSLGEGRIERRQSKWPDARKS